MKILFVHPAIRSYRSTLFKMLGDAGFDFLFTTINDSETPAGKETADILESFPYPWFQAREIKDLPAGNVSLDLWRVFQYDVIIFSCLTSIPFLLCAPLLKMLGRRLVLFDETWRYQYSVARYRILLPYVRFLVRKCIDAIVCAGSRTREMFAAEFKVDATKLYLAFNTTVDLQCSQVDKSKAKDIRISVEQFARGRTVVLFLARLVRIKALDVLIEALARCRSDCCLLVVGEGPEQDECQRLAENLGLRDRVCFVGACLSEDALYYYRTADVYVLPSRFTPGESIVGEAWGFSLNEAMSLETPVIATTAVGAAADLIVDGQTGMLAIENDPDSLASKIDDLLSNDERRIRIGRQGRRWLMERCSYDQNLTVWMSAIAAAGGINENR